MASSRSHCPCNSCKGIKMLAWSTITGHFRKHGFCDAEGMREAIATCKPEVLEETSEHCGCDICKRHPQKHCFFDPDDTREIRAPTKREFLELAEECGCRPLPSDDGQEPPVDGTRPFLRDVRANDSEKITDSCVSSSAGPPAPLPRPQFWALPPPVYFAPVPIQSDLYGWSAFPHRNASEYSERPPLGQMQLPRNVTRKRPPSKGESSTEEDKFAVRGTVIVNRLTNMKSPRTLRVIQEFMEKRGYREPTDWSNIRKDFRMCLRNRRRYKKKAQNKSGNVATASSDIDALDNVAPID